MAYEESLKCISVEAGSDLSARQYRYVVINSSGQLAVASAGSKADGILQDDPSAAGQAATLAIDGVSKIQVGAAVTAGDDLAVGSNGLAVTATSGDVVVGRALTTGSGLNSIISALIVRAPEPLS